ncbi:Gfo/Idh/MocA family protein [Falsirhodobacter sp. 20TX0035]|uniref:Gfo/Idh/MocA family protein n=1 Tax=Falsirhodobacter sp. 20TX0035 TaxID=3022019 RepID=UPI00232DB16E|nr:Gfo/Idh/MocA family oxidoreductase [Falsirhodobacter sp. 20TX0035]MDB6452937.1 Gfo/Idh/MocA family oxidoreductase [Falsirhodobacter sp. 20TX0035]
MTTPFTPSRRGVLMGGIGATALLATRASAQEYPAPTTVDTGTVSDGKVAFENWRAPADAPSGPPPAPLPPEERVGFAVVALGRLSLEELLPAFGECQRAKLVALVSGTPDKLKAVAEQYGIREENCYDYENFDTIRDNPEIQAVYIVLPNGMHREFTERAAAAGKHVLCEKPMANSSEEAKAMIDACEAANVKLMIAYRIQYETYNLKLAEFVRDGEFGRLVGMTATNVQTVADNGTEQWRHKKALAGGGALPDIGLYCLNTARFLTGEEPVQVWATQYSPEGDPRYAEVEETVSFTLRFPSNFIANCFTSYGARDDKHQRLNFAEATVDMPNAYKYTGQQMTIYRREGDATGGTNLELPHNNQFAAEIDHMADCVRENRIPRTPGQEGMQDHILMEAIYEAARTGQPVTLEPVEKIDAFRGPPATIRG